jgi:hypothetical protein
MVLSPKGALSLLNRPHRTANPTYRQFTINANHADADIGHYFRFTDTSPRTKIQL